MEFVRSCTTRHKNSQTQNVHTHVVITKPVLLDQLQSVSVHQDSGIRPTIR